MQPPPPTRGRSREAGLLHGRATLSLLELQRLAGNGAVGALVARFADEQCGCGGAGGTCACPGGGGSAKEVVGRGPNGVTVCNVDTGKVDVTITKESPFGRCVAAHEEEHRAHRAEPCRRVNLFMKANAANEELMSVGAKVWNAYLDHTRWASEAVAYAVGSDCLETAIRKHRKPPNDGTEDCRTMNEMLLSESAQEKDLAKELESDGSAYVSHLSLPDTVLHLKPGQFEAVV